MTRVCLIRGDRQLRAAYLCRHFIGRAAQVVLVDDSGIVAIS